MQIYLFVIDGKPGFRTELVRAQACLEDHLRERRDVSEVWWDDDYPYEARLYMYESKHWMVQAQPEGPGEHAIDYETTEQLIFPVSIGEMETESAHLDVLEAGAAQLSLSVVTEAGTETVTRVVPQWPKAVHLRGTVLSAFARETAVAMTIRWIGQEGS